MLLAEQEAARLASAHRSDSAAAQHHLSATKDVVLGPLHAGNNHVPQVQLGAHNSGHGHGWPAHPHHAVPASAYWHPYAVPTSAGAAAPEWPTYDAVKSGYNLWG